MMEQVSLPSQLKDAALKIYGDRLGLAERYVDHLATSGIERGLIGPREVPRLWDRHVLNCAVLSTVLPKNVLVADVGSGAGLPGLAVAIAREDLEFVLIEPLERRCLWLQEVVEDLGLENVEILRGRSEQFFDSVNADVVTARAVSALTKLLALTLPLVHGEGTLLALKGRSAHEEIEKASKSLKKYKAKAPSVELLGEGLLEEPTTIVRIDVGPGMTSGKTPTV